MNRLIVKIYYSDPIFLKTTLEEVEKLKKITSQMYVFQIPADSHNDIFFETVSL